MYQPLKRVLAVSGSLRHGSTNTLILQAVADRLPASVTMVFFDGLDDLPHFSPERDADHESGTATLPAVAHWREAIAQADVVLISTPEYAFGIPGVLKNGLDWTVSTVLFDQKPVGVISASPDYEGGQKAMASLLPTLVDEATAALLSRLAEQLVGGAS